MATVTKIATGAAVASGVYTNASWTNEGNVRNASDINAAGDGLYATIVSIGRNKEGGSLWPFVFGTSDIPNGSTISAVSVKVQWKNSVNSTNYQLHSSCFDGSNDTTATLLSAAPGVSRSPTPTTDTDDTYTLTTVPTLTQLRNGIWVRASALQGATNTGSTFSLDYIQVTVTFTPPSTPISGTDANSTTTESASVTRVQHTVAEGGGQTSSVKSPTAGASVGSESVAWSNPGNITVSDANAASVVGIGGQTSTPVQILVGTLPAIDANVVGILVRMFYLCNPDQGNVVLALSTGSVQFWDSSDTPIGTAKTILDSLLTKNGGWAWYPDLGGSSDKWGINDPSIISKIAVDLQELSGDGVFSADFSMNYIEVTVYVNNVAVVVTEDASVTTDSSAKSGSDSGGATEAIVLLAKPVATDANTTVLEVVSMKSMSADSNGAITESAALQVPLSGADTNGGTTEASTQQASASAADVSVVTTESVALKSVSADTGGAITEAVSLASSFLVADGNSAITETATAGTTVATSDVGGSVSEAAVLAATALSSDASSVVTDIAILLAKPVSTDINSTTTESGSAQAGSNSVSDSDSGTTTEVASESAVYLAIDIGSGAEVSSTNATITSGDNGLSSEGNIIVIYRSQSPSSDIATAGWTPTPGSPATLYDKVDDDSPDPSDYISAVAV